MSTPNESQPPRLEPEFKRYVQGDYPDEHEGHMCEKRCPKCGSVMLRNKLGKEWCSFVKCDFGIENPPVAGKTE